MKTRKIIMMNRKGDLLIFWHAKKQFFLENKFGVISTLQVYELIYQIQLDIKNEQLFFIGDL